MAKVLDCEDDWNSDPEPSFIQNTSFSRSRNNQQYGSGGGQQQSGNRQWNDDGQQQTGNRQWNDGGQTRGRGRGGRGAGGGRGGERGRSAFGGRRDGGERKVGENFNSSFDGRQSQSGSERTQNWGGSSFSSSDNNQRDGGERTQNWGGRNSSDFRQRDGDRTQNWGRNSSDFRGNSDNNSDAMEMVVSSTNVGRIIGKGGSKIRELESESGASIKVNKTDRHFESVVVIRGSPEAQAKAKEMIEDLINPYRNSVTWKENNSSTNDEQFQVEKPEIDWDEINRIYEDAQRKRLENLPPMIKNFYNEQPRVANLTMEQVAAIRKANNHTTVSYASTSLTEGKSKEEIIGKVPNPVTTFEEAFEDYPEILEEIRKQGFEKPSPIQCQAWPILLSGYDMVGIAQTGTGKTLAFLLPGLIHTDGQPVPRSQREGPNVLILAPTRELALQIEGEVKKYQYRGIRCACLYGGASRRDQIDLIEKGVEIVIATPGRLMDLVEADKISMNSVTYLILDEADRMLDMGFEPQIRKSLIQVRPDRQTVMTSATWPLGVRMLAKSYMKDPISVHVGSLDLTATHTVTQTIEIVQEEDKDHMLYEFIANMQPDDKVIVFVGKKVKADELSSELALKQIFCQSIHGNRDQADREQALDDIKTGLVRILIATDVASRGLDIADITHIINMDFPRNIEEYVHRVGRTGRAGKTGEAISYFTRSDWGSAKELIAILEEANQIVPEELYNMCERYDAMKQRRREEGGGFGGGGGRGGGRRGGGGRGGGGGFGGGGFGRGGGGGRRNDRW